MKCLIKYNDLTSVYDGLVQPFMLLLEPETMTEPDMSLLSLSSTDGVWWLIL